ncbi:MAG: flagellar FlbD family protein [Oscillospiraceae bacterium]|nr:flagellar FlbD family protein [Oscillospiraceae bacterium]
MIKASRLNGKEFYINPDLIEFIEHTPDTVLTMTTGKKVVVEESSEELYSRIVRHKQEVFLGMPKMVREDLLGASRGETDEGV